MSLAQAQRQVSVPDPAGSASVAPTGHPSACDLSLPAEGWALSSLVARDCMCRHWMAVDVEQRHADVMTPGASDPGVFAVFGNGQRFLGLVEARHAALFPGRIFADLLARRQPQPFASDSPLPTVLQRLRIAKCEYLPVLDQAGEFTGVVSMHCVFRALMAAEQSLRDERERLIGSLRAELENRRVAAAVFETTSEGILVTDAANRFILVNPAFTRTTGYTESEVLGGTPRILQSGRHGADFYEAMRHSLTESGRWQGEIWNRHKNGEVYPVWLHVNVVRDEAGAVRYHAGVYSDTILHEELRNRLHQLAYYDPLTALPNRQLFLDRLAQAVAQAQRVRGGFSLLFIDLDGFKDVNDTLGHSTGDRLLAAVAERLRAAVRRNDTVARLGGDEFTIILQDGVDESTVITVANKIFSGLAEPFVIDGHVLFVGASRYPDDGNTAEALLMAADSAMYRAKGEGKGRLSFYSAVFRQRASHRIEIVNALRHALNEGELRVFWQPQVSLTDGSIGGIEALLRWPRADAEEVPPSEFVPIAEQAGLIDALGDWVLKTACREAASLLQAHSGCRPRVAINFSPLQLKPGVEQTVIAAVQASGLDPALLEIELTESALAAGRDGILEFLRGLGEMGIEVAIDDFGTGCSNLATLKALPVHKVKIDRSFVRDLATAQDDREIVAAIVSMAHALRLKVVAEGVETLEQARILRELGCDMAQGFLYSPAVPLSELRSLLNRAAHSDWDRAQASV